MHDSKKGKTIYGANFSKLLVFAILCKKPSDKYPNTKLVEVLTTSGKMWIVVSADKTSGNNKTILPKMTGMLIKKDSSVALVPFVPQCFKKHMVVPLRDRPGNTATPCATPHQKAVLYGIVTRLCFCFFAILLVMSNTKVKANPTGKSKPSNTSGKNIFAIKPSVAVGKVAI